MEKQCTNCKQTKPVKDFNVRRKGSADGLQSWCRQCVREMINKKRKSFPSYKTEELRILSNIEYAKAVKAANGCCGPDCKEQDYCALDFHHLGDKKFCIGSVGRKIKRDELQAEIAKCIILCANCHRKLHGKRFTIEQCSIPKLHATLLSELQ
jgi:hypothetical protein